MRWAGGDYEHQQVESEVKAVTALCKQLHRNVVYISDHGPLDDVTYFIDMDLCHFNLREFLRGDKVKPDDWFLHWPLSIPHPEDIVFLCVADLSAVQSSDRLPYIICVMVLPAL